MKVNHKLPNTVSRQALLEFMRSILITSLPCRLLSRKENIIAVNDMAVTLNKFADCRHGTSTTINYPRACSTCARILGKVSVGFDGVVTTATRFGMVLAEIELSRRHAAGLSYAKHARKVLISALDMLSKINDLFDTAQAENAKSYSLLHKEAQNENISDSAGNARRVSVSKSEAAKPGELYPGRWLVQPRVALKNSPSGSDDGEECSKNYRRAPSHSPGLFTV